MSCVLLNGLRPRNPVWYSVVYRIIRIGFNQQWRPVEVNRCIMFLQWDIVSVAYLTVELWPRSMRWKCNEQLPRPDDGAWWNKMVSRRGKPKRKRKKKLSHLGFEGHEGSIGYHDLVGIRKGGTQQADHGNPLVSVEGVTNKHQPPVP